MGEKTDKIIGRAKQTVGAVTATRGPSAKGVPKGLGQARQEMTTVRARGDDATRPVVGSTQRWRTPLYAGRTAAGQLRDERVVAG